MIIGKKKKEKMVDQSEVMKQQTLASRRHRRIVKCAMFYCMCAIALLVIVLNIIAYTH